MAGREEIQYLAADGSTPPTICVDVGKLGAAAGQSKRRAGCASRPPTWVRMWSSRDRRGEGRRDRARDRSAGSARRREGLCRTQRHVVGLQHCGHFGEWSRDEDVVRVWVDIGYVRHTYRSDPFTFVPGASTAGMAPFPTTGDASILRVLVGIGPVFYGGLESALGDAWLQAATSPATNAGLYVAPDRGPRRPHRSCCAPASRLELAAGFRHESFWDLSSEGPDHRGLAEPARARSAARGRSVREAALVDRREARHEPAGGERAHDDLGRDVPYPEHGRDVIRDCDQTHRATCPTRIGPGLCSRAGGFMRLGFSVLLLACLGGLGGCVANGHLGVRAAVVVPTPAVVVEAPVVESARCGGRRRSAGSRRRSAPAFR